MSTRAPYEPAGIRPLVPDGGQATLRERVINDVLKDGSALKGIVRGGIPRRALAIAPEVTALPARPEIGDEVNFVADAASGVYWRLRNRGGGGLSWIPIGPAPLTDTEAIAGETGTSYGAPSSGAVPSIPLPLPGDYWVEWGALGANTTAGQTAFMAVFQSGTITPADVDAITIGNDAANYEQAHKGKRFNGLTATTLTLQTRVSANTGDWRGIELAAWPIRLGSS